ncbi:MAG: hypothetical protein HC778_05550, partial [Chamaesiphon sp. CSU_1_12]|nr:hypothetical protein [Chamaesiphon sp. CSU_1_12]
IAKPDRDEDFGDDFGEGDTIFVDCVVGGAPAETRTLTFGSKQTKSKNSTPAIIPEVILPTVAVDN